MKASLSLLVLAQFASAIYAQIPNSDFEIWNGGPTIADWQTNSCPLCVPPYNTYLIHQDSTDVYHGKYAARFEYGGLYHTIASTKFALTLHPAFLNAYVMQATHGITDTAFIHMRLYNNNAVVDSGQWVNTDSIATYSHIMIPVSQSLSPVDTADVTIEFTGILPPDPFPVLPNLWVDYLSLDFANGINSIAGKISVHVYPNPSNGKVTFELPQNSEGYTVTISNMIGQTITTIVTRQTFMLEDNLSKGIYNYRIHATDMIACGTLIIE